MPTASLHSRGTVPTSRRVVSEKRVRDQKEAQRENEGAHRAIILDAKTGIQRLLRSYLHAAHGAAHEDDGWLRNDVSPVKSRRIRAAEDEKVRWMWSTL